MIHGNCRKIVITTKKLSEEFVLVIQVDGKPIADNIVKKFNSEEIIKTIDRSHLGLSIIKRIILGHGWNIVLKNKPQTIYEIRISLEDVF